MEFSTLDYWFYFFILLNAFIHLYIFKIESLDFLKRKSYKVFGLTKEQADIARPWAYNQGFYNLFLALGLIYSFCLRFNWHGHESVLLSRYLLFFILAAGIVLGLSTKKIKSASYQVIPSIPGIILSFLSY